MEIYIVIIMLINLSIYFTLNNAISSCTTQFKLINAKIDKVAEKLNIEFENIDDELIELIKKGKKIKAIKLYREFSASSLKEAKKYIDSLK